MKKKILLGTKVTALLLATMMLLVVPLHATAIEIQPIATGTDISDDAVISTALQTMWESAPQDTYRTMIWLEDIDTSQAVTAATQQFENYETRSAYLNNTSNLTEAEAEELDLYVAAERNAKMECYQAYTAKMSAALLDKNEIVYASRYLPVVIADLSYTKAAQLATNDVVKNIEYYNDEIEEPIPTYPLAEPRSTIVEGTVYYDVGEILDYIDHAAFEDVHGMTGGGVKIGVFDYQLPNLSSYSQFNNLDITVRHAGQCEYNNHPVHVLEIISQIAPDATYYYTTCNLRDEYETPTIAEEIEWLLDQSVNVINISLNLNTSAAYNVYDSNARYLDQIIYYYYVSIIKTSGNVKTGESQGVNSGGMAYNVITVGNYNLGSNEIAPKSRYYSGNTLAFKPDISAPGLIHFSTTEANESGTSFAAPFVTGVAALLTSAGGGYRSNPLRIKATLLAGVKETITHYYTPVDTNYKKYGAGILDVGNVSAIAWDENYMEARLSTSTEHTYTIMLDYNSSVRIVLAFEKYGDSNYSLANLDLQLYNHSGDLVSVSQTSNNNVEIIDYHGASGIYTVKVVNVSAASNGSGIVTTDYAVAWLNY